MKKALVVLLLISFGLFAQKNKLNQISLSSGHILKVGQMFKVLTGSKADGGFKFIRQNKSAFSSILIQNAFSDIDAFPINKQGLKFTFTKFYRIGNENAGFVNYALFKVGVYNFEVDLENAIKAKEIGLESNIEVIDMPKEETIVNENINLPNKTLGQEYAQTKIETKPTVEIVEPKPKETTKVIEQQIPIIAEAKNPIIKTETTLNTTTFSPEVAKLIQLLTEQLTKELTIKITKELTEKLIKQLKQ
jgi:hypothetical protein